MADFDASIPLGIQPPQIRGGNALALAGGFADLGLKRAEMQLKANENQQFQLMLAARQKAGDIMASAPSIDEGIASLMQDPETSAFVPEIASTLQAAQHSIVSMEGERQSQAITGYDAVLKSLYPTLTNPDALPDILAGSLSTLGPNAAAAAEKYIPHLLKSLYDGLPEDPEAKAHEFQKRVAGLTVGAGVAPADVYAATGAIPPSIITTPTGEGGAPVTQVVGGTMTGDEASTGGLPATGLPISQQEEAQQVGGAAGDIQKEMSANAKALPQALKRLDNIMGALGSFQAGGGAELRGAAGKALQALRSMGISGITQEMIDGVANGSLAATQVFENNVAPLVIGELKSAVQGTGQAMRPEVDAFLDMMDANTDPKALLTLMNQFRQSLQINYDMTKHFVEFKKDLKTGKLKDSGYDNIADFPMWYNENYAKADLPAGTGGGENLSPSPDSAVKGAGTPAGKKSLDDIFGAK